jgi:hypothetical protein
VVILVLVVLLLYLVLPLVIGEPHRLEASNGIWDTDEAQRRGFLEVSAHDAPWPLRQCPGENGSGKLARRAALQRKGGVEGRKRFCAEPHRGQSRDRNRELLVERRCAPDIYRPEPGVP